MSQPLVTEAYLRNLMPFQCVPNPDGSSSMVSQPGIICYDSDEHVSRPHPAFSSWDPVFFFTWGFLGTHGVDMACLPKHFEKMSLPEHLISPCRHLIFAFSQHPVYNELVQETTRGSFPDPES